MELKEGMYVRTKQGTIRKIIEDLGKDEVYKNMRYFETDKLNEHRNTTYYLYEEDILKASYNIIDLIEVGDYVNGLLIVDKFYDYANKEMVFQTDRCNFRDLEDIKSIVTKEQFSQMKYKVGEIDERRFIENNKHVRYTTTTKVFPE